MKIQLIGETKVIMQSDDPVHNYFGWPSVERTKDGRIAVACSGFRVSHVCPFGKAVLSFSDDEGETFTKPEYVIDTTLDDRDAGLCAFGESGLIITSFNNSVKFQRENCYEPKKQYCYDYLDTVTEDDEKRDLGSEFRISLDNGKSWSKIYHSPITSPHGPIELKDGRILWVGRNFSEVNDYSEKNFIQVWEMNTNGEMKFIGEIPNIYLNNEPVQFHEPHMIETDDGKLICHIRAEEMGYFTTFESVSDDYGVTWSKPVQLLSDRGGAPAHLYKHSSGVLISAYGYRDLPYGVRVMLSSDNGKTWEKDHIIYSQELTGDLGYPATVELNDGSLLTVFYAHHESEENPAVIMMQKWRIV